MLIIRAYGVEFCGQDKEEIIQDIIDFEWDNGIENYIDLDTVEVEEVI